MASKNTGRVAAAVTRPQGGAIGDVSRGVTTNRVSEDQRRAEGTDASNAPGAGDHDESPEASKGQVPGGSVIDTYAGMPGSTHDNRADAGQPLVLGQAPTTPCVPMRGSKAYQEKFHPAVPNAINRSPVVVGADEKGNRADAPSFEDVKAKLVDEDDKPADATEEDTAV